MIKIIKYSVISLVTFLACGIILTSVIFGPVLFRDTPRCDKDSKAVNYARSLSQERLEKLYSDMEDFYAREDVPYGGYVSNSQTSLPQEFADLEVVKVRPKQENIMIMGCFDHYVYLRFDGIRDDKPKRIILQYGEHDIGVETLWPKD